MADTSSLVLVGAGGLAREVLDTIDAANAAGADWIVRGILDDQAALTGTLVRAVEVLGSTELIAKLPGSRVLLCLGSPTNRAVRRRVAQRLQLPADRYATLVHPGAQLAGTTRIGNGTIVLAGVVATADVTIGEHCVLMPSSVLTHDDVVGDFATIAAGVRLAGGVTVGSEAYLGSGCLVRERTRIGARALIGMGSVVLSDVPADETWVGTPARRLG